MADPSRISAKSQTSLVKYTSHILSENTKRQDMFNKMAYIDAAYARYIASTTDADGVDQVAANVACGIDLADVTAPIVISQVDSHVGYLADVFLSGYPIFPVVSTPANKKDAMTLQSIIDTHAMLGSYPRQLLKFLRDCVKYNMGAIEVDWAPIERYSLDMNILKPSEPNRVKKGHEQYNKLRWIDMYNLIYDQRVTDMADVPYCGEYVGYVEMLSRIELVRLLQYLETTVYGYNTTQALHTALGTINKPSIPDGMGSYYRPRPQISDIVVTKKFSQFLEMDWERWLNSQPQKTGRTVRGMYEVATIYARIIPEEHGIYCPGYKTPQIWKLKVVNNEKLICAQRIISAYDVLPILIGQPIEDGFGEQTQSIGENQIPMQEAASGLINIRFAAARRAVADRALYDPKIIDPSDINRPIPAPKIPIKPGSLIGGKKMTDAYHQIPFDARGTENAIQDAGVMYDMSGKLSGLNKPQQGEFQKGNKSVKEWNDTMAGSDNRLRLPALVLEYQVFMPLKEIIKFNIYQYGPTGVFMNVKYGQAVEVTEEQIASLRKQVLYYKLADGYIPASKLASTDTIKEGMMMINQSPVLQAQLGPVLPNIWSHLMQLGGVHGLDEYLPAGAQGMPVQQIPPQGGENQ